MRAIVEAWENLSSSKKKERLRVLKNDLALYAGYHFFVADLLIYNLVSPRLGTLQ